MTMKSAHWFAVAILIVASAPGAFAQGGTPGVDPHKLYETKCMGCHNEHGADLARQRFSIVTDKLQVTRTGTAVDRLLRRHYGVKLTVPELEALTRLFKSGIQWGGVFQRRCARCHDKGVTYARSRLVLKDGVVRVAKDDGDVGAFLTRGHGEATAAEIQTLLEMFKYQLETAPK